MKLGVEVDCCTARTLATAALMSTSYAPPNNVGYVVRLLSALNYLRHTYDR